MVHRYYAAFSHTPFLLFPMVNYPVYPCKQVQHKQVLREIAVIMIKFV